MKKRIYIGLYFTDFIFTSNTDVLLQKVGDIFP